jgi:Putative citrate transport
LGSNPVPDVYFWNAGRLYSALDDAPTNLGFFERASGMTGSKSVPDLLANHASHIMATSR